MQHRLTFAFVSVALAFSACNKPSMTETGTGSTTQEGTAGMSETGASSTTSAPTTSGTTELTGSFVMEPDGGLGTKECDIWAQDCPEGEKCVPWDNTNMGSWNSTKCEKVPENAGGAGDKCTFEGDGTTGIDSCGKGLLCWYFDGMGGGTCAEMCTGTADAPMCPDGKVCDESNEGVIILCLVSCDPLVQSCPDSQICFFDGVDTFICDYDASGEEGQYGDPCAYINVCDYGLWCAPPETVPGCDSTDGCCNSYCSLEEPNTCPGMADGQECVPWYADGQAPPGQENIGTCSLPV